MANDRNMRRSFIKTAVTGSVATLLLDSIVSTAMPGKKPGTIKLNPKDIILFQGDSITDAGRNKEGTESNSGKALGGGYAMLAGAELLNRHPSKALAIYNKGISGNKVFQLAERWDTDCLAIKPNVLSLLIGVNDFWHTLNNNYKGTLDTYRNDLNALLERTVTQLPNIKLIIGEPFAITGVKAVDSRWFPAFSAYQTAAREAASNFKAVFIPYQSIFDEAIKLAPGAYWTPDGVHPSLAGNELMAKAWLKAIS